jgi:hypothetical protein
MSSRTYAKSGFAFGSPSTSSGTVVLYLPFVLLFSLVERKKKYSFRTFAHSALACGSMVLYRYCMSFFRPAGRKNNIQGIEHDWQAKVLSLKDEVPYRLILA